MPTNKLRTEDIKEIEDNKIDLSSDHPSFSIAMGDSLDEVLPLVSGQILSIAQKLSLSQAVSSPNALNPVVLKDDLEAYVADVSLGTIKDSVATLTDLPLSGNAVGDLRSVLDLGIVYRWSEALTWVEFLRLGTLLHTSLTDQDSSLQYQHITSDQKTTLLNEIHTHANGALLDGITDAGSGKILEDEERDRIPTLQEKGALAGTAYTPSVVNRFVTSQDPRLNTLKNPYVTYGPEGTITTFQKEDVENLIAALAYVATAEVRSVQVLPGLYRLNFSGDYRPVVWDSAGKVAVTVVYDKESDLIIPAPLPYREVENNALLLECMALRNTVLRFECFSPGLQLIGPGSSQATVRGLVFELRSDGTSGIRVTRPNTLIEECTFRSAPGASLAHGLLGVSVEAPDCVIRRCFFEGVLSEGLVVDAERTRVEDCQFNLSSSLSTALKLKDKSDFSIVNNCTFVKGRVSVESQALSNLFTGNTHGDESPFIDSGTATRWLSNRPGRFQQAYVGRTRTVGPANSFADFVGNDQTPFLQAFADPYTKEVLVLPGGSYVFTQTVDVPEGVAVRGANAANTTPQFICSGLPIFNLKSRTTLENLSFSGLNTDLVVVDGGQERVEVKNCHFNVQSSGFFGLAARLASKFLRVDGCYFVGSRGLYLSEAESTYVHRCHFSTISMDVESEDLRACHFHRCWFFSTVAAVFSGDNCIVAENHFLGAIPAKTATSKTTWQANWPHPRTNNEDGVDFLKISLDSLLAPVPGTGASRALASGVRVLAFEETGNGTAVTLPTKFTSRIERSSSFEVHIYWTTNSVFNGSVLWDVSLTFRYRNGSQFGATSSRSVLSQRDRLLFNQEQKVILTFNSADYGLALGVDVSHVTVIVRRLSDSALDTLAGTALVTEAQLILPRD